MAKVTKTEDRGGEDHTDKQQHGIDDQFHR
jgi:hypothetical protein